MFFIQYADKFSMEKTKNFKEVLNQFLQENPSVNLENDSQNSSFSHSVDPLGMAYLMGELKFYHFSVNTRFSRGKYQFSTGKNSHFQRENQDKTNPKRASHPKSDHASDPFKKTRPSHKFTPRQLEAFQFLSQRENLNSGFTLDELKNAFRSLAIKLHPDHGGSSVDYILLREAYQTLKKVLNN